MEWVVPCRWRPQGFINVHSGEWAVYTPWDSKAAVPPGLRVCEDPPKQQLSQWARLVF